jgi:hypothetical protein
VKRKRYPRKFQRMTVERMRSSDNIGDLAKELGVGRRCLYKWQAKLASWIFAVRCLYSRFGGPSFCAHTRYEYIYFIPHHGAEMG